MLNAPLPIGEFDELAILIRGHHPLISIQAREPARVDVLLRYLSRKFELPFFEWTHGVGLRRSDQTQSVYGSEPVVKALSHIASGNVVGIYHFNMAGAALDDPRAVTLLNQLAQQFSRHPGAVIFSFVDHFPKEVLDSLASVRLRPPSPKEYYEYIDGIIKDIRQRQDVAVRLDKEQLLELLSHLKGLTLMEVRRVITGAIIERGALDEHAVLQVIAAKGKSISQNVGLEYYPAATDFQQIAGMRQLRSWLNKRATLFRNPTKAREYGLSSPRGLLLLGVQGCGKSATAKAVAQAFRLPLLRLDAGRLYDKYMGGTERNLAEALQTAERLAPVVLWVDEIEKALSQGGDSDGGTSQRVLGTFLTWLAENQAGVFVVATANNIKRLPPELLRKGRFDEIFFVDLPSDEVRQEILAVHLSKRDRDPGRFDLAQISAATEGFSGGELEQAVVSALFSAFNDDRELSTATLLGEVAQTKPLSVTMAEDVAALRAWATGRTTLAD